MGAKTKKHKKVSENSQMLAEKAKRAREEKERRQEAERKRKNQEEYCKRVAETRKDRRTSIVKLAGVKSTFQLDENTLLVTSFGRGNDAVLDHRIEAVGTKDEIHKLTQESGIQIDPVEQKRFPARGREIDGVYPTGYIQDFRAVSAEPEQSYAMLQKKIKKEWLERHFFGETYADNIHVQIAYSILGIKKSLALHVNNLIYTLNNLKRNSDAMRYDMIGNMPFRIPYEEFVVNNTKKGRELRGELINFTENPRIGYFGDVFTFRANQSAEERYQYTYEILAAISLVRNCCAHHQEDGCASLYNLTTEGNAQKRSALLDRLYREKIESLHKDFAENSFVNIAILKELPAFKDVGWDKLAGAYYQYSMRKEHKNLGFSIKKLREKLIDKNPAWRDQKFDSVRGKFYQLLDYLLYFHYAPMGEYTAACEEMVETLRRCLTDQDKDAIYEKAVQQAWEQQKKSLELLPQKMTGEYIKDQKTKYTQSEDALFANRREAMRAGIAEEQIRADVCVPDDLNADLFCKMIYLLTRFLDGKEINDLLTNLIHQFENIASFLKVLQGVNLPCQWNHDYQMFEYSQPIADGLRLINNFAKMSKENDKAKMYMYVEASQILGLQDSEEQLQAMWQDIFQEGREHRSNHVRHPNGFRNFIVNNVVKSSRFRYLIRYSDPFTVSTVAKNRSIVEYVLSTMPDTQIERYYRSCHWNEFDSIEKKREKLAEQIREFSYDKIKNTVEDLNRLNKDGKFSDNGKEKQQLVTLTSLYLTVLYLTSKNLVLVNSRYFLAFHMLELDKTIYHEWIVKMHGQDHAKFVLGKDVNLQKDRCVLTDVWVAEGKHHEINRFAGRFDEEHKPRYSDRIKHHERMQEWDYLYKNLVEVKRIPATVITQFRNRVAHLNFVRRAYEVLEARGDDRPSSYFQLYHYIVQKELVPYMSRQQEIKEKLECHFKTGDYSRDFVKWISIPFGYNLPRYKNLTIERLFDKDHVVDEKAKQRPTASKKAEKSK